MPPIIGFIVAIAILYFARELLIPFALALLFAFLLSPIVKRLELWKLPKAPAAFLVFFIAFGIAAGVGWVVADQLVQVAAGLPRYSDNVRRKIMAFKGASGSMDKLIAGIEEIDKEINVGSPDAETNRPLPVQVIQARNVFQSARDLLSGLLKPLGTAGITMVFTLFMLADREDLRNRLLRLMGQRQMHATTKAMDDAAQRVSRYVLLQLAVNAGFGTVVGAGLYFIGVPNAFLWGALAVLLRFLPYVGPVIAGSMPFILAIAIADGWRTPLLVFLLFLVTELVTGNVLEPLLYGVNTGLSTVAVLVAAVFWTVLWGPIGLILSTPLTVCLSALGRYVPQLEFLNILLGDEPVLSPEAILYQRLLAFDHRDAFTLIETSLKESPAIEVYDQVLIPALTMLEQDRHSGLLEAKREDFILQSIKELVTELVELESDVAAAADSGKARVFCISANDAADEIAAAMFAQMAAREGHPTLSFPAMDSPGELMQGLGVANTDVVVVSSVPPLALSHARKTARQIHEALPGATVLVGLWNYPMTSPKTLERLTDSVAGPVVTTLAEGMLYLNGSRESGTNLAVLGNGGNREN